MNQSRYHRIAVASRSCLCLTVTRPTAFPTASKAVENQPPQGLPPVSTTGRRVLAPKIACGYHINMPYLCNFLKRSPRDEVEQGLAVLTVIGWWLDLPRDQRRNVPQPYKLIPKDGTSPNDNDVALVTRIEIIKSRQDIDEKLQETDADRAKRAKFIEVMCAAEEKKVDDFDGSQMTFEMKPWTPEQTKKESDFPY